MSPDPVSAQSSSRIWCPEENCGWHDQLECGHPIPPSPGREKDAVELLDRLYGRKAGHPLHDSGMFEEWLDGEIMAFIRKHGAFKDQLRDLNDG